MSGSGHRRYPDTGEKRMGARGSLGSIAWGSVVVPVGPWFLTVGESASLDATGAGLAESVRLRLQKILDTHSRTTPIPPQGPASTLRCQKDQPPNHTGRPVLVDPQFECMGGGCEVRGLVDPSVASQSGAIDRRTCSIGRGGDGRDLVDAKLSQRLDPCHFANCAVRATIPFLRVLCLAVTFQQAISVFLCSRGHFSTLTVWL